MFRRRRAREVALQVLYQDDLNKQLNPAIADAFIDVRLATDDLRAFCRSLVAGVRRNRHEIDELLRKIADNWKLERMAAIDRNVIRLGTFEILFTETPDRIIINESIELAKRYGAKQSSQFVNGILDRVSNQHGKPEKRAADVAKPTPEKH
ncbi:MAG: transcription antitermination factor NusB [Pirellulales bacterium]